MKKPFEDQAIKEAAQKNIEALKKVQEKVVVDETIVLEPESIQEYPANDLLTFETMVNTALLNKHPFVEASEKVFNYFTKGVPTPYLTYKGVKVYKPGTRDALEKFEAMSIDQRLQLEHEKAKVG